tara:strand:- start:577 stop:945 length:369 start_codon:yes stop_codon:yes gene_type:complete
MATFDAQTVGSDVAPSYAPTLSIENNVITVSLGDGYQQRLSKGVNPSRRTFTLSFKNRSTTVTTNILNFLASSTGGNNGAKSFTWSPPFGSTGKWICQNPQVTIVAHNLNDIELVFQEVFEP